MIDSQPKSSPMRSSVETKKLLPTPSKNSSSSDVIATRHLRLVLESITADTSLTVEQRKQKIADFGAVLMASVGHDPNEAKEMTVTSNTPILQTPISPPKQSEGNKEKLFRAALMASAEKTAPTSSSFNDNKEPKEHTTTSEAAPIVSSSISAVSVISSISASQHSKPNAKAEVLTATRLQSKTNKKKKKGWIFGRMGKKNREMNGALDECDEARGDVGKRDIESSSRAPAEVFVVSNVADGCSAHNSSSSSAEHGDSSGNGGDDNESVGSDRSIGTFERDHINNIIYDQMKENSNELVLESANSEGTFEQDAKALDKDNNPEIEDLVITNSECTFEQDARAKEASQPYTSAVLVPKQATPAGLVIDPNLSETTFEQDARGGGGDPGDNQGYVGTVDSDLSDGTFGSETTFERDMRKRSAAKTAEAPTLFIPLFEKDAKARETAAEKARMAPLIQLDDYYSSEEVEEATSDCSANFAKDVGNDMRPKTHTVPETVDAPIALQKISELQMELSPEAISKASAKNGFFSKFTCKCL